MSYIDVYGIKKDVTDILRDYLYPRETLGTSFYNDSLNVKYAQSFIPFSTSMNSISVYCNTIGTGLDNMTISVQADTNDSPSGTRLKSVVFTPSEITDDAWDTKKCSYSNLISKNKYWLVFESNYQNSNKYYRVGCDSVRTNYQEGIPKDCTISTWNTISYDIKFNIDTPHWIYPKYPSDTIQLEDLPRIAVDVFNRTTYDRYCSDSIVLADIEVMVLIYTQYPDEADKILSYGERGLFKRRGHFPHDVSLLTPLVISPTDKIGENLYTKSSTYKLRKKLSYMNQVPLIT